MVIVQGKMCQQTLSFVGNMPSSLANRCVQFMSSVFYHKMMCFRSS